MHYKLCTLHIIILVSMYEVGSFTPLMFIMWVQDILRINAYSNQQCFTHFLLSIAIGNSIPLTILDLLSIYSFSFSLKVTPSMYRNYPASKLLPAHSTNPLRIPGNRIFTVMTFGPYHSLQGHVDFASKFQGDKSNEQNAGMIGTIFIKCTLKNRNFVYTA